MLWGFGPARPTVEPRHAEANKWRGSCCGISRVGLSDNNDADDRHDDNAYNDGEVNKLLPLLLLLTLMLLLIYDDADDDDADDDDDYHYYCYSSCCWYYYYYDDDCDYDYDYDNHCYDFVNHCHYHYHQAISGTSPQRTLEVH